MPEQITSRLIAASGAYHDLLGHSKHRVLINDNIYKTLVIFIITYVRDLDNLEKLKTRTY